MRLDLKKSLGNSGLDYAFSLLQTHREITTYYELVQLLFPRDCVIDL
jgi:hypothetical protein